MDGADQRQRLQFQADRIEATLAQHGAPGRVTGGTVTPRWVRFLVLPASSTRMSRIKTLADDLALVLEASDCRIARRGAAVAIEIPRANPLPVRLLPMLAQINGEAPSLAPVLGLGEDGSPLLLRLPSPDVAHVLIAGTTGSGKTVLLRTIVLSLAMRHASSKELALVLLDPRGGAALGCFDGLPQLARPVIVDVDEAIEALGSLTKLMERRDRTGEMQPLLWPNNLSIPFWCDSKPEFASGKTVVSSKAMNDLG